MPTGWALQTIWYLFGHMSYLVGRKKKKRKKKVATTSSYSVCMRACVCPSCDIDQGAVHLSGQQQGVTFMNLATICIFHRATQAKLSRAFKTSWVGAKSPPNSSIAHIYTHIVILYVNHERPTAIAWYHTSYDPSTVNSCQLKRKINKFIDYFKDHSFYKWIFTINNKFIVHGVVNT